MQGASEPFRCQLLIRPYQTRPYQTVPVRVNLTCTPLSLSRARLLVLSRPLAPLAPLQALARMRDATGKALVVEALPSFVESIRRHAFHVDVLYWSPASVERISKYVAKGFECAVPGVRRAAFGDPTTEKTVNSYAGGKFTSSVVQLTAEEREAADQRLLEERELNPYPYHFNPTGYDRTGIARLFDAEAEVLRSRAYTPISGTLEAMCVEMIEGRLTSMEAATIASKLAGKLGTGVDPNWKPPPPRPRYDDEDWYHDEFDGYGCRSNGPHTNS